MGEWVCFHCLSMFVNEEKVKGLTFFTFQSLNGSTGISKIKKGKKNLGKC